MAIALSISSFKAERDAFYFLKRLGLFLLPILIAIPLTEWRLHNLGAMGLKRRVMDMQAPKIEVLFLGSSHAANGIRPDRVSVPAFNLASTAQSLPVDLELAQRYAGRLPRLRLIVFTFSAFSLEYRLAHQSEYRLRNFEYMNYYGISGDDPSIRQWDIRRFSLLALYGLTNARQLLSMDRDVDDSLTRNAGWEGTGGRMNPSMYDQGLRQYRGHRERMHPQDRQDILDQLDNALHRLHAQGIPYIFLSLPVHPCYAHVASDLLHKNHDFLTKFSKQLGIPYFDYTWDPRFKDADFSDPSHLNLAGADHFTKILDQEVIQPFLAK